MVAEARDPKWFGDCPDGPECGGGVDRWALFDARDGRPWRFCVNHARDVASIPHTLTEAARNSANLYPGHMGRCGCRSCQETPDEAA